MTLTAEVKKFTDSKPFYAVAGAGDYAVEKLLELPEQFQKLQARRGEIRETAKDIPTKAREYASTVQVKAEAVARDFPEKARGYADTAAAKFNELYDDLALRGRKIVSKVSGEAAQELEEVSESARPALAPKRTTNQAKKPGRPKSTPKA